MRKEQFLLFRVFNSQDDEAYGELHELYVEKIGRFISFRVPRTEDADELTAEVFMRGWEYATSNKIENVNALFHRIARNLIADFYRKRGKEVELEEASKVPDPSLGAPAELAARQEYEMVTKKFALLKEEYRDVLVMRFTEEMSIDEIAKALDKSASNVRTLVYRATKALRKLVDQQL